VFSVCIRFPSPLCSRGARVNVEPGEVALKTVAAVNGHRDAVEPARIDDQLGIGPQAFERLVYLSEFREAKSVCTQTSRGCCMMKTAFLIDDRFKLHDPGRCHPESPKRLSYIQQALEDLRIGERWTRIQPRMAREDELELVHTPGHIQTIRRACEHAPSFLDADTPVSSESCAIACLAAGGVLACTDSIARGEAVRAFAFVRPPGHHAEPNRAMGFCLFNNAALGAAYLRKEHGLDRVAVVDIDIHHGNGTQACFYEDPGVLYVSTHQYPYYPGTGAFSEVGAGEGWGYTANLPLPAGTGDPVFVPLYSRIISAILDQYRPECIIVSAGFDALLGDPLGGLSVSVAGYASAAASLLKAADRNCGGRICFVLEGGYSPRGLQECTQAVMKEMESEDLKELSFPEDPLFTMIVKHAEADLGEHWRW